MYWSEIMKNQSDKRAIELGQFIIENKSTVRAAAGEFGISKSTVHKDVTERLSKINPALAFETKKILDENKAERHIRGGEATREKYKHT
jgi:putative DeoR family transcriptional regulator (stage III sporulation protein D)